MQLTNAGNLVNTVILQVCHEDVPSLSVDADAERRRQLDRLHSADLAGWCDVAQHTRP